MACWSRVLDISTIIEFPLSHAPQGCPSKKARAVGPTQAVTSFQEGGGGSKEVSICLYLRPCADFDV